MAYHDSAGPSLPKEEQEAQVIIGPAVTETLTHIIDRPKALPSWRTSPAPPDDGVISRPIASPPPVWDMEDRSFEDIRRPALRKKAGLDPTPSASEIVENKEAQLIEEEAKKRKELGLLMSDKEVEEKLKDEFGERWRQLQLEMDALNGS